MAQEKIITSPRESTIPARVGRIASVDVYEVKSEELQLLQHGSYADVFLNLAVFLFSLGFSGFSTLCTTEKFKHPYIDSIFLFVTTLSIIGGIILAVIYFFSKQSTTDIFNTIRGRIPPPVDKDFSQPSGTTPKE